MSNSRVLQDDRGLDVLEPGELGEEPLGGPEGERNDKAEAERGGDPVVDLAGAEELRTERTPSDSLTSRMCGSEGRLKECNADPRGKLTVLLYDWAFWPDQRRVPAMSKRAARC